MLSEELRKRIAALNRRSLRHASEGSAGEPEAEARRDRDAGRRRPPAGQFAGEGPLMPPQEVRVVASPADARPRISLAEAVGGVEAVSEAGQFLVVEYGLPELLPGSEGFNRRYAEAVRTSPGLAQPERVHPDLHPMADAGPESVLFVDIEATGLSAGTPLFLIGVLHYAGEALVCRQLLARDYTEEPGVLLRFAQLIEQAQVVVSFNGKSYDLPYIRDRSVFMGVSFDLGAYHLDLIHECRRRWKRRLPNCRLQTLERYVCRRVRQGDIPGAEIPEAYHRFVQTGNAVQMRDILYHNALDLITLAEILTFMLEGRKL